MSDNGVSIPPLRTGVVFAEWAPVVRDKLKAAKHGIIFRMPDPRKRSRFTGSSQCAQENHPLINTVPPKETVSEYADLCEKWAAASQSAAAKIRLALSKDTCKGANLLPDQDGHVCSGRLAVRTHCGRRVCGIQLARTRRFSFRLLLLPLGGPRLTPMHRQNRSRIGTIGHA